MMFKYKCPACGKIQESSQPPKIIHTCYYCGKVDIPLYAADLFYLKPSPIIRIIENELLRRDLKDSVKVHFYWTDRRGEKQEISKLSTEHLKGIIGRMKKLEESNV